MSVRRSFGNDPCLLYFGLTSIITMCAVLRVFLVYNNIAAIVLYSFIDSLFLTVHFIHLYNSSQPEFINMIWGNAEFSSKWKRLLNFSFRWIYPIIFYIISVIPDIIYQITDNKEQFNLNIFIFFFILSCAFAFEMIIILTLSSEHITYSEV